MSSSPSHHLQGAPLLPPVLAYVLLALADLVIPPLVAGRSAYSSDADLLAFYQDDPGAAHTLAFLTLASAVPFAVTAAIASHRVRSAGLDVPGRLIALVGGTIAAAMLAMSGLLSLALTGDRVADDVGVVRALNALAFSVGGPGFVVFSGLLLAGVSVPLLVGRLAPRWVGWLGLALAVVCELGSLVAAWHALTPLLPVGRFGSMIWLLAIAFTLTGRRPEARDDGGEVA